MIHRVFSSTSAIQIRITDQSLEILNECNTSDIIHAQDLKKPHLSKPQNRLLADVFYKAGLIESWGRGTIKIVDDCLQSGLKEPEFENTENHFSLLFHRISENFTENFTENLKQIVLLIMRNPNITVEQLSIKVGISKRAITNNTNKLKKIGIIERVGSPKGGKWKIIKQ